MNEMFKNYPQPENYIPDNRPKCIKPCGINIMTGESAIHSFEIPFNVEEDCKYIEIIYKLGLDIVILKTNEEIDLYSYITKNGVDEINDFLMEYEFPFIIQYIF